VPILENGIFQPKAISASLPAGRQENRLDFFVTFFIKKKSK